MKSLKTFSAVLSVCAVALFAFAQEGTNKSAPPAAPKSPGSSVVATLKAADATITAPLVLKEGAIGQPAQTELPEGGKATFKFTLAKAGTYLIVGVVNAPSEDANSFFLNVDAQPEDPLMIWDIDVTTGFEERTVSWRGNGDASSDEFTPKRFNLTAGEHKLIIVGREPAQLKSISIRLVN